MALHWARSSGGPPGHPGAAVSVLALASFVAVLSALLPVTEAEFCLDLKNAGIELPVLAENSVSSGTVFEGWAFDAADTPRVVNSPAQAPQGASYAAHIERSRVCVKMRRKERVRERDVRSPRPCCPS